MRIQGNATTQIGGSALQSAPGQAVQRPVGEQVQQRLFGRVRPRLLEASAFPELAELMRILHGYRRKLCALIGDPESTYDLVLADDAIAAIDEHGTIYLGMAFLRAHRRNLPVLIGALAHEIGHQPHRWRDRRYQVSRSLSQADMDALCRQEEINADRFAGRALAELGEDCAPLIDFLRAVQVQPHPAYLPADQRGEVIREAYSRGAYRAESRRKLFPQHDRHVAAKGYLGEF